MIFTIKLIILSFCNQFKQLILNRLHFNASNFYLIFKSIYSIILIIQNTVRICIKETAKIKSSGGSFLFKTKKKLAIQ